MQLTQDEIIACTHNSIHHHQDGDWLSFLRFSERQLENFSDNPLSASMSLCSAGVCLCFETNGSQVSLQCRPRKITLRAGGPSNAANDRQRQALDELSGTLEETGVTPDLRQHFDVWLDGQQTGSIPLKSGAIDIDTSNPEHAWREVKIWLPLYSPIEIGAVSLDGQFRPLQSRAEKTLLCLGDSITQGYLVGQPSHAYAQSLARQLDARLLNQGMAGAVFDPNSLPAAGELPAPDLVTVCYGSNDWFLGFSLQEIEHNAAAAFSRLRSLCPGAAIFAITPLWRADMHSRKRSGSLYDAIRAIESAARQTGSIHIIDGLRLSPASAEYYADGFLHPDSAGHEFIAAGLRPQIERLMGGRRLPGEKENGRFP